MNKNDLTTGIAVTIGLAVASGAAGGFVTNLVSTNPTQIAKGVGIAAANPTAFSATCAAAAYLSDRED